MHPPNRPDTVRVHAPAKINLFLHAGERGADGYHPLQSLVVFTEYGDELEIAPADKLGLAIDGLFAAGLSADDDNLVLKAARMLAGHAGMRAGAHIRLTKNIPLASGVGGGSADGAATLRGLVGLWGLDLGPDALRVLGLRLGADVPMCIESRAAWVEGRGERIRTLDDFPGFALVLVNPGIPLSTADVFRHVRQRTGVTGSIPTRAFAGLPALLDYLHTTQNDLQRPACEMASSVGDALEALRALPGILLARMSGSGATCFGLFETRAQAGSAAAALRRSRPGWWVVDTQPAHCG